MGQNPDEAKLATDFNWPAVMDGFRATGKLDYAAAHSELLKTPDGTPGKNPPLFPGGATQADGGEFLPTRTQTKKTRRRTCTTSATLIR